MDLESKQLLERFSVNLRQLEQSYGATTLARGLAYFHEKKVIKTDRSLSLVDDEMLIVGTVSNGRGIHYLVRLRLCPGLDGLVEDDLSSLGFPRGLRGFFRNVWSGGDF